MSQARQEASADKPSAPPMIDADLLSEPVSGMADALPESPTAIRYTEKLHQPIHEKPDKPRVKKFHAPHLGSVDRSILNSTAFTFAPAANARGHLSVKPLGHQMLQNQVRADASEKNRTFSADIQVLGDSNTKDGQHATEKLALIRTKQNLVSEIRPRDLFPSSNETSAGGRGIRETVEEIIHTQSRRASPAPSPLHSTNDSDSLLISSRHDSHPCSVEEDTDTTSYNQPHQSVQENEVLPKAATSRASVTQGQKRNSSRGSPLAPTKSCNRITKSDESVTGRPPVITPTTKSGKMPSEDDILMLLMRKHRQRNESAELERSAHEKELCRLQNKLSTHETRSEEKLTQVRAALAMRDENSRDMREKLDFFKARFEKLTQWAKGITTMNAELKVEGNQLQQQAKTLKGDGEDVYNSITEFRADVLEASTRSTKAWKDICEVRAEVGKITLQLAFTQQMLAEERSQKEEERLRNVKYKSHIQQLENSQNILCKAVVGLQQTLSENTKTILNKFEQNAGKRIGTEVEACMKVLTSLVKRPTLDVDKVESASQAICTLSQQVSSISGIMDTAVKSDEVSKSQMLKLFESLRQDFGKMQPSLSTFADLKISHGQLQERLKSEIQIQDILKNDKETSITREQALLKFNSEVISKLDVSQNLREICNTQLSEAQKYTIAELSLRHGRANSDLKSAEQEVEACEFRMASLTSDYSLMKETLELDAAIMQSEHEEMIASILREGKARDHEHYLAYEIELGSRDKKVARAERDLRIGKCLLRVTNEEIQRLEMSSLHITRELTRAQAEALNKSAEVERLNELLAGYNQQQEVSQSLADKLADLEGELKRKDQELTSLQDQLAKSHALESKLADIQQECIVKSKRLSDTEDKLFSAQQSCQKIEDMQNQVVCRIKDNSALQEKLLEAEIEVSNSLTLAQQLRTEEAKVVNLANELESAKLEANQLTLAANENQRLRDQLAELNDKFDNKCLEASKADELEISIREKDRLIAELRKSTTDLQRIFRELDAVRKESQLKDVELASLHDRLLLMERNSQQIENSGEYYADEFAAGFSQATMLSIESMTGPDSLEPTVQGNRLQKSQHETHDDPITMELFLQQRRIANRSAPSLLRPISNTITETQDSIHATDIDSSGATNLVPNSQINESIDMSGFQKPGIEEPTSPLTEPDELVEIDETAMSLEDPHTGSLYEHMSFIVPETLVVKEQQGIKQAGCTDRPPTSHSDMLFHSSDPMGREEVDLSHSQSQILTTSLHTTNHPVSTVQTSPNGLRNRNVVRQTTPLRDSSPVLSDVVGIIPGGILRNQPNSAAKRRGEVLVPTSQNNEGGKRLRRTAAGVRFQPPDGSSGPKRASGKLSEFDLPPDSGTQASSGSRPGSSSHNRSGKKPKSLRRSARSDLYAARFG